MNWLKVVKHCRIALAGSRTSKQGDIYQNGRFKSYANCVGWKYCWLLQQRPRPFASLAGYNERERRLRHKLATRIINSSGFIRAWIIRRTRYRARKFSVLRLVRLLSDKTARRKFTTYKTNEKQTIDLPNVFQYSKITSTKSPDSITFNGTYSGW